MAMAEKSPINATKFTVQGVMKNAARTDINIGAHRVVIDEPKNRGGTDKGPTPTEILAASLVGCSNVIINRIAEQNGIKIHTMAIELETTCDFRGVIGLAEVERPFTRMDLSITMTTDADHVSIELLKRELPKRCPVNVALRAAGTELVETWNVMAP